MTIIQKSQQQQLDNALFKKLQQLNQKIPNDPQLYREDIHKYSEMYKEQFNKLLIDIQRKNERYAQLLIFLSKSVRFFGKELAYVPKQVIQLLKNHGPNLHAYVRKKCVGSIMILRAKNILYPVQTIQFLLTLFNIQDKQLRKTLYKYLINDIKRMNKHHKNNKINQEIRNYIYDNIIKNSDKMVQKSLQIMIQLYKKNIWTDNRSVNIIAEGCFCLTAKIRIIAAYFLISTTQQLQQLSDSDEEILKPSQIRYHKGITKHTKKREKQIEKQKKKVAKKQRKKQILVHKQNYMPIDVIYNPQIFAQKLYNLILKKNIKYQHKLIFMSLISRLIWRHKLIILSWYGSLIKYMEPKQKQVFKILTYFAQSIHQNIPDDVIETVIKHIIEKFINDRCSEFSITIGLNTIRQVYAKINYIINQQTMLYLTTYYQYKNKNVRMAAKALINLVRSTHPYLLPKKYRGRYTDQANNITKFGQIHAANTIDGAELLQHQGQLPIQYDKILTDEDFKKIRKLKRKQQQEQQYKKITQMEQIQKQQVQLNDEQLQQEYQDEEIQENQNQDIQENYQSEEVNSDNQSIVDECNESELDESGSFQQVQQGSGLELESGSEDEYEGDEEQELQCQDDDIEPIQQPNKSVKNLQNDDLWVDYQQESEMKSENKQKAKKNKNIIPDQIEAEVLMPNANTKKNRNNKQQQSSSQQQIQQQQQNGHGFININQIAYYKKSKREIKADKRRNGDKKQKYKHSPKQKKGGGTSNKQKTKLKPLLMLRAKKNKIRSKQKQIKCKINSLKNQLGKVKSGKQAKILKRKRIMKKYK